MITVKQKLERQGRKDKREGLVFVRAKNSKLLGGKVDAEFIRKRNEERREAERERKRSPEVKEILRELEEIKGRLEKLEKGDKNG